MAGMLCLQMLPIFTKGPILQTVLFFIPSNLLVSLMVLGILVIFGFRISRQATLGDFGRKPPQVVENI